MGRYGYQKEGIRLSKKVRYGYQKKGDMVIKKEDTCSNFFFLKRYTYDKKSIYIGYLKIGENRKNLKKLFISVVLAYNLRAIETERKFIDLSS